MKKKDNLWPRLKHHKHSLESTCKLLQLPYQLQPSLKLLLYSLLIPPILVLPPRLWRCSSATYSHSKSQSGLSLLTIPNTNMFLVTFNHSQPQSILSLSAITVDKNPQYLDYCLRKHILGHIQPILFNSLTQDYPDCLCFCFFVLLYLTNWSACLHKDWYSNEWLFPSPEPWLLW